MSSNEIVAIVDEQNQVVGAASRAEMRAGRLLHRAAYILVFNRLGQLFVQKRTDSKDIYPGFYDVAAGGVLLAGESYEESAVRELAEELGISAPLTFCFDHFYEDADNRVWGRVFTCRHDGPMQLQAEEVAEGFFLPLPAVLELSRNASFTPDGLEIIVRLQPRGREEDAA